MSTAIESPSLLPLQLPVPARTLALEHWGVIRATGVDTASFLQGQLTQDVLTLALGQSRLAAFCSAKGRMLASFWVLKRLGTDAQPEFLLVCSRDVLAQTLKRLSMFVLRAKVKMTDATSDFRIFGAVGWPPAVQMGTNLADTIGGKAAAHVGFETISLPATAATIASAASSSSTGTLRRVLWLAPHTPDQAETEAVGTPLAADIWQWLEVQSGVAMISLPTVDAFVPQMLNYESVGGVNFKKGCYPGQEVVARSQFRGTLKRRAYIVHGDSAMAAGDLLFGPLDAEQACGSVVQAAPAPHGGFDAVVSMQVAAAQTGKLTLGSPVGGALQILPLPYALLEDI